MIQKDRVWIISHPDYLIPEYNLKILEQKYFKLLEGMPLPYLIEHWEFFGLDFYVNENVLIPRPETELLVEYAIDHLKNTGQNNLCLDIGTGSGCIPISITKYLKNIHFLATDISKKALDVAKLNLNKHGLTKNIDLIQSYLFPPINIKFQMICANLPYIPSEELKTLSVSKYEPDLALDGGNDGMNLINQVIFLSKFFLSKNGFILLEIEENHSTETHLIARDNFPNRDIKIIKDLNYRPRLVIIK